MPDIVIISNEQVELPKIPLTEAELLAWLAEQKQKEADENPS